MSREFVGLWRRSLLALPDGSSDDTTHVTWLQGPSLFADLRQPTQRPACCLVQSLGGLSPEACRWLATQAGFAGTFQIQSGIADWRREIDFQPLAALPDSGELEWHGDILVERGIHAPYFEHWHVSGEVLAPCFAFRLQSSEDGRGAILVRSGPFFMLARDRAPGTVLMQASLSACIAIAPDLASMRALLDCEISFGRADAGWKITHSTLPWREGRHVAVARRGTNGFILDGAEWAILHSEGEEVLA
ncbi:hypothetical protein [Acidocella sp.]|uniref:hypothetical protein n=1 Tax=Acidocella sp. TaxID=50710 RepID=UPI0026268898|nr:hypothetical protein [Acidocella sp.]